MKAFLDNNIWLRLLIKDNKNIQLFNQSLALFEKIENSIIQAYTSSIVLLEINYVLEKIYKVDKKTIEKYIEKILQTRNLTLIEKTEFAKAFEIHKKTNIKIADCLIACQVPTDMVIVTFDNDFKKIKNIISQTPGEFLS